MIRKPDSIKKGDTIGITAPSFGAAIEPYSFLIDIAENRIKGRGYNIIEGKTARMGDGLGISTDPKVTGAELTDFYKRDDIDAIITAGGGELMVETISNVDFEIIKSARPKWFVGYSDNTSFLLPLVTIAKTCGIYGPNITGYAKEWEGTENDAFALLEGTKKVFKGYDKFVKPKDEKEEIDYSKPFVYNCDAKKVLTNYDCSSKKAEKTDGKVSMQGILLGGCIDVMANMIGTRFDKVADFVKKCDDKILWVIENCELNPMSYRRAIWNMKEAGWFENVGGFIVGRSNGCFDGDMMGVDRFNALTDLLQDYGTPIIFDADIGHIDPMLPVVMGARADVSADADNLEIRYL